MEMTSVKGERGEDAEEAISDMLLSAPFLQPMEIVVDAKEGEFLEFGSSPARITAKKNNGVSEVLLEIRKWVEIKLGITDRSQCNSVAYRIYKDIMEHGMAPQPFFRVAIHAIFCESSNSDVPVPAKWLEQGKGLEDIAHDIADEMVRILTENNSIYTGNIVRSIHVEHDLGGEIARSDDAQPFNSVNDENIWKSDRLDRHGVDRVNKRNIR